MDPAATLVLADGSSFEGYSFGALRSVTGEAVFQTGMVGYPESLTDPSYKGQILVLTYPLIGNYGVPSLTEVDSNNLPLFIESGAIHVTALIVGMYSHDYSHWRALQSLGEWLKTQNVPAIYGVDTRAITKKIRTAGVMLGKIIIHTDGVKEPLEFQDPNALNLVAQVSTKEVKVFKPTTTDTHVVGANLRIIAVDVGMKYNQIRCFTKRGVELTVVPWDYDFNATDDYDGLFISNGPGDPVMCTATIDNLRKALQRNKPIFGICLGHQLLALAAGGKTEKMKFGNRGQNLPCIDQTTGRCYITSQNHGYAVKVDTLPSEWQELFVNANDRSNEGIYHTSKPFFSVQFHPESSPGPKDTEYLFDSFLKLVKSCKETQQLLPLPQGIRVKPTERVKVSKVLVLGSGGLSIGQAGEFDYSGSQAIKALKQEGIYTVLINPNIATIQTSTGLADKVYFLPVNAEFVRKVILFEKPDGIFVSFGGQTALNVGVELKDEFEALGVKVLGTPIDTVILTEDREMFAQAMLSIGERCAKSASATNTPTAIKAANDIGYPCIIRAAFALGGLGSGFANNDAEMSELCAKAFAFSPQVLIERSMKGWKEIEYEVVRDINDNCITVCNMENFDPLGIHTGDSIVVAPSQTLTDHDYYRLRTTAVNVVRHLGVVGECNIQYAVNPDSDEYCIIEVNARLSRSSALASKATGYPLAYVAAKLGLGIPLTEIQNNVTKQTCACFEPSLDYCVVKIPRWDLKKFTRVSKKIASAMKSVGEVMAIGKTFEETIQKAIRAIDNSFSGFERNDIAEATDEALSVPTDQRLFAVANALHNGYSVDRVWELTKIDKWFLNKLMHVVNLDRELCKFEKQTLPRDLLLRAKKLGFADAQIARCIGSSALAVRSLRQDAHIVPFIKQIDTVAAEFPAFTNYLYMTYNAVENDVEFKDSGIMVLGSGVYRIGSSVEFDWCAVRAIRTLRAQGLKTIMVNYNPETVSTDYDEADRLYFENITLETVLDIYQTEQSLGVVISMGGQTPNTIALGLHRQNVRILGTSPEMIDTAENRYKFSRLLDRISVNQPQWKELTSVQDAQAFCEKVSYPVLVRPSYVLSGAAMNVVFSREDLEAYLNQAAAVSLEHPVVISKYIQDAKEIEMDAVAKQGKLVMHVISEHVENAGVHSGDATLVLPPQDLDQETVRKIEKATMLIADALNVTGPFNIQFIAKDREIKVIECNLRASRSFPFDSKVLGVDLIEMATRVMLDLPVEPYPKININYVGVKVPQFSFSRLSGADPVLGVEMASTGEVACFGKDKYEAYLKALISTAFKLPKRNGNILLSIGSFKEKAEIVPSVRKLFQMGFKLFATPGTADFLSEQGIPVTFLEVFQEDDGDIKKQEYSLTNALASKQIDLYINLPSMNNFRRPANYVSRGYLTRRMAVDFSVPLITNIKCAKLFIEALSRKDDMPIRSHDYKTMHETISLPGFVDIHTILSPLGSLVGDHLEKLTKAALSGGFTFLALDASISSLEALQSFRQAAKDRAFSDFAFVVRSSADNELLSAARDVFALKLLAPSNISQMTSIFATWPVSVPLVTSARGTDLGAVLFLASLSDRKVHVAQVTSKDDMKLIQAAKAKNVAVSCDVSIYSLFFTTADFPSQNEQALPLDVQLSLEDQEFLWRNLDIIDCFSCGGISVVSTAQATVESESKRIEQLCHRLQEAVPLLLAAVNQKRLTLADIKMRLYDNPIRLFGLTIQPQTSFEIELDREFFVGVRWPTAAGLHPSPLDKKTLAGFISRVTLRGATVYQDGRVLSNVGFGVERPMHRTVEDTFEPKTPTATEPLASTTTVSLLQQTDSSGSPAQRITTPMMTSLPMASPALAAMTSAAVPGSLVRQSTFDSARPTHDWLLTSPSLPPLAPPVPVVPAFAIAPSPLTQSTSSSNISATATTTAPTPPTSSSTISTQSSLTSLMDRSRLLRSTTAKPSIRHVLSVKQFQRNDLHAIFGLAQEMKTAVEREVASDALRGKVLCTLFYEPSTRTSASFDSAMKRLGGQVINVNSTTSSVSKGESLGDTIRTVMMYSDVIALRHPGVGSAQEAAKYSNVPIINAGDGIGEHPTQALLDVFTIREELGTVNGLNVTLVGDLKNGRTVHSLVRLLALYNVRLRYVSVAELAMPKEILEELSAQGVVQTVHKSVDDVIAVTDVLYVTRVQKERFSDLQEYERVRNGTRITLATLTRAKETMLVMHPLPRVDEIDPEVDFDPRAAYFRQMRYGLFIRMALLLTVLGKA